MAEQEKTVREQHGATERVRRLREESLNTQPRIYMERAVLETEAYEKYEGTVSVPELRGNRQTSGRIKKAATSAARH